MTHDEVKKLTDLFSVIVAITYQNQKKLLALELLLEARPELKAEFLQAVQQVRSDNSGKETVEAFSEFLKTQ